MAFCSGCGAGLAEGSAFCSACGASASKGSGVASTAAKATPEGEKIFFDSNGVVVSSSRFIVNGQTFAMHGITSVKLTVTAASKKGPVIVGGLGALILALRMGDASNGLGSLRTARSARTCRPIRTRGQKSDRGTAQ